MHHHRYKLEPERHCTAGYSLVREAHVGARAASSLWHLLPAVTFQWRLEGQRSLRRVLHREKFQRRAGVAAQRLLWVMVLPQENAMKTKILFVCAVVLLLVGWGIIPDVLARQVLESQGGRPESEVDAETIIVENLGAASVAADVYRLSCFAECIRADVNDTGPFNDTIFKVVVSGSSV